MPMHVWLPSASCGVLMDISLPQPHEDQEQVTCKLCRRQFAKYTCPTCNAPYCSLTCFRSQSHNQCSESFYKKELESDIATTPSRSTEERNRMLEVLKRFEEEAAEDKDLLEKEALGEVDDETENEDELVSKFTGIDINTLTPEEMWEMLSPAEKQKFMKTLEDPTGELAQTLLGSENLELELEQPWWTKDDGLRPTPMNLPRSMVSAVPNGHPLVFNLCAIMIAYSYTVRHLGICMLSSLSQANPDHAEALRLIGQLVPFLVDNQSRTLHASVGAVVTDVYSRFDMGKVTSELMSVLLEDVTKLMKPSHIVDLEDVPSQSHPDGIDLVAIKSHSHATTTLVLSDLADLFRLEGQHSAPAPSENQPNTSTHGFQHVVRKLEFYVSHVLSTPSSILEGVCREALQWSEKVGAEGRSVMVEDLRRVERVAKERKIIEEIDIIDN